MAKNTNITSPIHFKDDANFLVQRLIYHKEQGFLSFVNDFKKELNAEEIHDVIKERHNKLKTGEQKLSKTAIKIEISEALKEELEIKRESFQVGQIINGKTYRDKKEAARKHG